MLGPVQRADLITIVALAVLIGVVAVLALLFLFPYEPGRHRRARKRQGPPGR